MLVVTFRAILVVPAGKIWLLTGLLIRSVGVIYV